MKSLIISFFGALLVYSFFFDKEGSKGDMDLRNGNDTPPYEQNVLQKQEDSVSMLYIQPNSNVLTENFTR